MMSPRLLAVAAGFLVAASAAAQPALSEVDRVYGLSTFWKEVDYNFAFFDQVPGLDWDSVYVSLLPEAAAAQDTFAYFRVLQKMVATLDDGHTNVYLPRDFDRSRYVAAPAIQLKALGHRAIVDNVGEALADALPIGSEILRVDGLSVEEKIRRDVFPYFSTSAEHVRWAGAIQGNAWHAIGLLVGPPGSVAALTIRTPDGEVREVSVPRDTSGPDIAWVRAPEGPKERFAWRWLPGDVAYVEVNTMGDDAVVADFEAALPDLQQARGLIVDLRANGGGNTSVAAGIARYLLADTTRGSAWRTREHRAAHKAWGTGAPAFGVPGAEEWRGYVDGTVWFEGEPDVLAPADTNQLLVPTAVLTGWRTASAAEDFLIYLDGQPHVVKVGGPTYGSTGQPLMLDLPGGISARICTKRDTYPDGRDFVGPGVLPDVLVEETVEDVASGRDAVLERAQSVLAERLAER